MRKLILAVFGIMVATGFSQVANADAGQNLKSLDNVYVTVNQSQTAPVISANTVLQLETDTKLKLKSAGISLADSLGARKAVFDIGIENIKGITNEWVLIQVFVIEDVNTIGRKTSQNIGATTYLDQAFFEVPMNKADKKIYDVALNDLVTKFVAKYLDQNSK
jgi:hypothetical protein